jgi:ribosomal protein S18 acetylase RimI-like enzyme
VLGDERALAKLNAFVHDVHVMNNPDDFKPALLEEVAIGVRPDQRRKGLARALVDIVVAASDADGIRDVELTSWVFNSGAQEAFRRLGFTPKLVRLGRRSSVLPRKP